MKSAEREKFVRTANKRVNSALKSIQEIGKLSNRAVYEYGSEDVEKIIQSLQKEVEDCRKRFELSLRVDSWVQFDLED